MSEIQTIDVQVYPNWGGGDVHIPYYHPKTLERISSSTFADEALVEKWKQRVLDVARDPTRFLLHVHEDYEGYAKEYLYDYLAFIKEHSAEGRHLTVHQRDLDNEGQLRSAIENMQLKIADNVRVVAYGHHRGDCVPEVGMQVVHELGLPETSFEENQELSVGDMLDDRLQLIPSANPTLGDYYSIERFNSLPIGSPEVRELYSRQRYLLLYCSPEQIIDAAHHARSIEEFEILIGGDFATYDHPTEQVKLMQRARERAKA